MSHSEWTCRGRCLALAGLLILIHACGGQTPAPAQDEQLFTAYYTLAVSDHGLVVDAADVHPGGGLARLGDRVVVMTGKGATYAIEQSPVTGLKGRRLPLPPPADPVSFRPAASNEIEWRSFRAHGILGRRAGDGWQVFVVHHVFDPSRHCVEMVVSAAVLNLTLDGVTEGWTVVTRLQPCLPVGGEVRGVPFAGLEAGGRMRWLDDNRFLLTTGDHQFDGVNRAIAAAQRDDYQYGKTLVIDVRTGATTPFTKGHRNPQGLYIDPAGRIWSAEQGPRGGDELNLLVRGGNYGWPYETLGTEYNVLSWPLADNPPVNGAFRSPTFAWVPSIAISSLIGIERDRFPRWKGNLLAGSLAARSLYRVVLGDAGDRVVAVEPIAIGRRIRDLIEGPAGQVWLWVDTGTLLTLDMAGQDARGAQLFMACAGCHTIVSDRLPGGLAPNLFGVIGRPVASNEPYAGYTDALKAAGGEWTEERLDAFLAAPSEFAPGTSMTYRVPAAEDRAAIIEFLRGRRGARTVPRQ